MVENIVVAVKPNTVDVEKRNLPNTIMTYCRRHDNLKGYAVPENGNLICNSRYFKEEIPERLKNSKCIYQEKGTIICCNGDIRKHYDRVNLEETRKKEYLKRRDEIFNIGRD